MAHHIDRIALWLFAALSAFILMLVLTDGSIMLSIAVSFAAVSLLRILLRKFVPERKWISRKARIRRIDRLLCSWVLMDEQDARSEIHRLFPDLPDDFLFIQRMPQGESFSANELLSLWRSLKAENAQSEHVFVFMLCALTEDADRLLPDLHSPHMEILDKNGIVLRLLKVFDSLPADKMQNIQTEQHRSFSDRAALFVQNVRPLRVGIYLSFFAVMYLISGSILYLLSGILYALLLAAHLLARRRLIR